MQHLDHAMQIAMDAHDGQTDKTGRPFFEHCQRVALLVSGEESRTVAYLHDVAEKGSGWTIDRLKEEGFPAAIISAVDALTQRPDEPDEEFVRRASANPLALPVKRADLEDNLRQAEQTGKEKEKYQRGLDLLRDIENRQ
ncbi:HD domain-containing protein [Rhizobium binae]|uniref:metal-dependent phosphohydrolase n=1 Tax=Rhizobium binae TaxID=1138190 RepID=UPI001C83C931|nr:metal-dependent phosphohydrolase [Rhizobium binae]MBX4950120.1 HD domain-containing protein [Rhizobium binae]